jgi:tripartite-type tricarboxylate transporter receptor subunit TctC
MSTTRASGLPDVPTMAEGGLKGFEIVARRVRAGRYDAIDGGAGQ